MTFYATPILFFCENKVTLQYLKVGPFLLNFFTYCIIQERKHTKMLQFLFTKFVEQWLQCSHFLKFSLSGKIFTAKLGEVRQNLMTCAPISWKGREIYLPSNSAAFSWNSLSIALLLYYVCKKRRRETSQLTELRLWKWQFFQLKMGFK